MHTDEHLEEQPSLNFNAYVKLTRLTKEDIERNTTQNHKKENTNMLKLDTSIGSASIKQEILECLENANVQIYESTIEHTSWQSSVEEFGINVKIEPTDEVTVKTEQENNIRNIIESTTFPNYVKNVNGKYICKICYADFNSFEECIVHKNITHKITPYVCKICNVRFELMAHYNLHLSDHVDYLLMRNSSVNPSDTQSSPNVSSNFTQNCCETDPNVNQNTLKSFKCLNCVFATGSEAKFLNHHNICSNISNKSSKLYQCNFCTKSFKTHAALNGHLKYHAHRSETTSRRQLALDKKKTKSQNKNSSVKSQKYFFPKIANFNRSLKCKDCNRHFTTRSKLNIHYKQHKQQMKCNKCHKKFVLKKNFEKHLLSHMSNKISNDTSFNESNSLHDRGAIIGSIKHRTVSETKIITSTDDKGEKQNISKNEKSFQCFYCNNFFKSKQSLSQHNRQHHSRFKLPARKLKSKTVECNWCSLVITKCNLLRHIKSLHPEINPIKCPCCPVAFKDSLSLKVHMSKYHTI